jgi:hypothetical protein
MEGVMKNILSGLVALVVAIAPLSGADADLVQVGNGNNSDHTAAASVSSDGSNASPAPSTLEARFAEQQREIEELRKIIAEQNKTIEKISERISVKAAEPSAAVGTETTTIGSAVPDHKLPNLGDVASISPIIPQGVAPAPVFQAPAAGGADQPSPLQIHIGDATITPVGFMDITHTFRSTNAGTSLQTNFGNFPYSNTFQYHNSESKWSAENSRLGLRVDVPVKGANVLGYFEGDFVGGYGNGANNGQVSSNSALFRIRQYYVDVRKGFWEVLAGQAWSLILPNRRGMSPLPADLFYSQVVDVNYTNGLFWGRIPGFRFIGHPSKTVAFGIALENSTQYFGGSGGGGVPTLPAAFASNSNYNSQIDNGVNNDRGDANVHPDIIGKITYDPSSRAHFEIGGVESTVRLYNPNTNEHYSKAGVGGTLDFHYEVVKNFRVLTNNFWSDGNGRYLFGAVPDFIVRADGSPSLEHALSTVSGVEATIKSVFQPYIYYGGVYASRNTAIDADGKTRIGYGYTGSPNSQNRSIQEITGGWTQTLWRDSRYGALQYMVQYAYFVRNPWYVAALTPKNTHMHAVWFNFRYVLPGTAPTIKY